MPRPSDSLLQECSTCGALLDVSGEEPFALMHCPTCGAAIRVRRRFDHFVIQEELGAGGMGTVYRALDTNLNRLVALKLLQREHSGNPEFIAQFKKEAAITASINHPHVVKVYSTGRDHGLVYIAMELVDKGSLESLMNAQGRVAELQLLTIGIQIAQGLNAALEKGLIHRDIKPGNILFANPATAKMVDFGLAVLAEHAGTIAGEVWATPFYVAPEVVEGQREDFRSDLYSLGATLFHALAGKPPHDVETNSMSALAAAKKAPVSLQEAWPEVSSATAFALNKVLSHDPANRQKSYTEFIEHLEFARNELAEAIRHPQQHAPSAEVRSYAWLTWVTAATVVAAGVLAFEFGGPLLHPRTPVEAVEEEVPQTKEGISAKYEEARRLLAAGEAVKAAEILTRLDAQAEPPQPLRNWITLHAGLAELASGHAEQAQPHFAALEKRGIYSPDPAEQELANFFVQTAQLAGGAKPVTAESVKNIDHGNHEVIALLLFALKDWSLAEYDEAWPLFRQFALATPQDRSGWVSEYKPLVSPYMNEINAFRAAAAAAQGATTIDTRKRALQLARDTKAQCKLASRFPSQLETLARDLEQKITAEEEETARRMAAIEAADAKALAEAKNQLVPLWAQFRPGEALAIVQALAVTGEKGQSQRTILLKRMEWLAKFKTTLISDLNTMGYPSPVLKKGGGQIPGPVRRANDTQIETVTPFGSLPALWSDLAPESVIAMGKSFLRPDLPDETLADREWLLGVYAIYAGKPREGRELLVQAGQAKPEYREELSLFLDSADAPQN
jgi:hypothetical protein